MSLFGPSFTVFASSVPSADFQYDPVTSSLAARSLKVAGLPFFVMTVLSVTLKTRDDSLPAIVKVFAFSSTAEIMPRRNGIARSVFAGDAADDAVSLADDFDFFSAADIASELQMNVARQTLMVRTVLCFIVLLGC